MNLLNEGPLSSAEITELLTEARARTQWLVRPLSEADLTAQHDPLMSPIVWDLGHIAHFEEVWLIENLETGGGGSEGLRGMFNPFENPRRIRDQLPLPSSEECWRYLAEVRGRVIEHLGRVDLDGDERLLRDGFVFRMVLQHEYQHNETILQTLQLKKGDPYPALPSLQLPHNGSVPDSGMVRFPGGRVSIGTDGVSAAYDNERPEHELEIAPFLIDATAVTNEAFAHFMAEGGYEREELWTPDGWAWVIETGTRAPKHWSRVGDEWVTRVMDRTGPVDPHAPVCHVCYHEADAYARFAGKRLPTEFEWEAAATWDPGSGMRRAYPWGDDPATPANANVDVVRFGTAPVGTYADNVSPIGCYGMIGDVWEWTSTDFHGYPGYETFPYPEYSEVFFGDEYKVLRGGSWATRGGALRSTFRNWDYPIRRQIFSGFRCAKDDGR